MTTHPTLRAAIQARMEEWDGQSNVKLGHSFYGNELAGELGELLDASVDFLILGARSLRICNVIKKLDRERLGMVGSRATLEDLSDEMADALICLRRIEVLFDIDLDAAAARKFNKTSEKNGLATKVVEV